MEAYIEKILVPYLSGKRMELINWDQMGINYVPVGSWMMEKERCKRVEIAVVGNERQITAVFAGSLAGAI